MGARGPPRGRRGTSLPRRRGFSAAGAVGRRRAGCRLALAGAAGRRKFLALFWRKSVFLHALTNIIGRGVLRDPPKCLGWCEEEFFPSLFMSAWWFDADGEALITKNPFLISSKPFRLRGYCSSRTSVARSVGFSPFNRDDPSDWIRQQDRGFAAVKGYHYPSSGNTSRSGNRSLWNSSLGNVSNWKRSPYRSRRLTKRRNANQWTKKKSSTSYRRPDASQEEDIEEESIPEEDEENTPHVAGIDDAAME